MLTPEGRVRRALLPRLEAFAIANGRSLKFRSNSDAFVKGEPDLELVWRGRYIGVELKSLVGQPEPMQLRKLMAVHAAGGYACVVRPAGRGVFRCEPFDGGEPFTFRRVEELLSAVEASQQRVE